MVKTEEFLIAYHCFSMQLSCGVCSVLHFMECYSLQFSHLLLPLAHRMKMFFENQPLCNSIKGQGNQTEWHPIEFCPTRHTNSRMASGKHFMVHCSAGFYAHNGFLN